MSSSQTPAIGQRVLANYDFIRALCRTRSSNKTDRLLKAASEDQLLTLVEVALNVLKSRFPLNPRQRQKLLPLADTVRRLSRSRSAKSARVIIQKGGNPLLSALLLPIAIEVGRYFLQRDGSKDGPSA
jgi:hypothetical protein